MGKLLVLANRLRGEQPQPDREMVLVNRLRGEQPREKEKVGLQVRRRS